MEHALVLDRARIPFAPVVVVMIVAALGLSACGRKGALDLPPADTAPPVTPTASTTSTPGLLPGSADAATGNEQENAVRNGFDNHGNPVAGPGQKKSFFLDPLLQ
jgi:predicted small lipoprotein YifL